MSDPEEKVKDISIDGVTQSPLHYFLGLYVVDFTTDHV